MNKIEYMIITKQEGSFCNSKSSFINLLQVDSSIKINNNIVSYKEQGTIIDIDFKVVTNEIKSKQERYFHITLINNDDSKNNSFRKLSEKIKEIAMKINPNKMKINTLWDDTGRNYAIQAYPLVNEVENLMRKLITQFMLVNVGMEWTSNSLHENLQNVVESRNDINELYEDDLFKTNFIDLVDVLFKKYRTLSVEKMNELLSKATNITELDLKQLKEFLPKSNWERYFSEKIKYGEDKLKSKWKILYDLRNNIAHNRYLNEEDYKKINGITLELKGIIQKTIDNLNNINLTEDEKEDIITTYMSKNLVHRGYIAEEAVARWYSQKFKCNTLKFNTDFKRNYDFAISLKDNVEIAVNIKYSRLANIRMIIRDQIKRFKNNDEFNEQHLVLVLSDNIEVDSILDRTDEMPFKLIVGYLNSFNEFVEIANIMSTVPEPNLV